MTAPALKLPAPATLDDLLAIPESERRHELIDGHLGEKGATSGKHAAVQSNLSISVAPFRRQHGGRWPGGWWFATEADVYFDPANTFRPDVSGWRRERMPESPDTSPVIMLRPDWVCEILSTNRRTDLIKKKRVYHRTQVPHYWIVDPVEETLTVYRWTPDGYLELLVAERGERVRAEPFEAISLLVGFLFGDDDDGGEQA
jgi:Uma2 family endonuclease